MRRQIGRHVILHSFFLIDADDIPCPLFLEVGQKKPAAAADFKKRHIAPALGRSTEYVIELTAMLTLDHRRNVGSARRPGGVEIYRFGVGHGLMTPMKLALQIAGASVRSRDRTP